MAKDLPYFKFVISEWNDGDVTLCSLEAQGLFINLCSIYWSQEGNMSLAKSKRRFNGCNAAAWEQLINDKVIKVKGDRIIINFLDEQFKDRGKLSSTNSENASKGWEKRRNNASEMQPHTDGIKVVSNIEEKREEENKREEKITEEKRENFDVLFLKAFDENTCESYKLPFRGIDLGAELQKFRTKCDNNKSKYYGYDVGALRSAFQYQLSNVRSNGKRTNGVNNPTESELDEAIRQELNPEGTA